MRCCIHVTLCVIVIVSLMLAALFAIPAGVNYPDEKAEATAYWKTNCVVTECHAVDPTYDQITYESREYFHHEGTAEYKHGCILHPINSTIICYVNARNLTLKKPGGNSGLVCMIFASSLCGIGVLTGLVWTAMTILSKFIERRSEAVLPAPPPARPQKIATRPSEPKEDECVSLGSTL